MRAILASTTDPTKQRAIQNAIAFSLEPGVARIQAAREARERGEKHGDDDDEREEEKGKEEER